MPYRKTTSLPKGVKDNLPQPAQRIFLEAFNNAWKQYADPRKRRGGSSHEAVARKVAWSAVKKEYRKDGRSGKWIRRK